MAAVRRSTSATERKFDPGPWPLPLPLPLPLRGAFAPGEARAKARARARTTRPELTIRGTKERFPRLGGRVIFCLAVGIATPSLGCTLENPSVVRDTTGAELGWECDYGACTTVRESFSPPVPTGCGEDTELLVGAGALAILCAVSRAPDGSDLVHERTCRPLACRDELDCPQWSARTYACVADICQTDGVFDRVDVTALCLFDVERHASCGDAEDDPLVGARMALVDAACPGDRCLSAPEPCLAP